MKKQINAPIVIILIVLSLTIGIFWGSTATIKRMGNTALSPYPSSGKFTDKMEAIWSLIDRHYVDLLDNDTVMDRMYASMLAALDPHSRYLSQQEIASEMESLRGNFEGVGIILRFINDTVRASQIIPEGPAEKAGLQAGDIILAVNGEPVSGVKMGNDEVVKKIRGPRKSIVDLKIKRPSEDGLRHFKVVRDVIETPSISYSGMLDATTGYIRLTRFGESTLDEFRTSVSTLKKQGMQKMVLDLRNNSGGLLTAAIGICDELLPGKEMIVYTEGAHQRKQVERSHKGGLFDEGELIVMINEYWASASEIVAGAIQDNDRGLVVGRRSFGKGLVQQRFELPDQSALLLTIARYYTPSGRCIQRPYDRGSDEYYNDFIQQVIDGYVNDSLLSQITDSTPFYTTKGRVVYGGGGIYPDHSIGYKSDSNVVYYNQLISKNIVNDYVFDLVSSRGQTIKKQYKTPESFVSAYRVSDAMLEEIFNKAQQKGVDRNMRSIAKYKEDIRTYVKAEIAMMLYNTSSFYALTIKNDPELQEAVTYFKKK